MYIDTYDYINSDCYLHVVLYGYRYWRGHISAYILCTIPKDIPHWNQGYSALNPRSVRAESKVFPHNSFRIASNVFQYNSKIISRRLQGYFLWRNPRSFHIVSKASLFKRQGHSHLDRRVIPRIRRRYFATAVDVIPQRIQGQSAPKPKAFHATCGCFLSRIQSLSALDARSCCTKC